MRAVSLDSLSLKGMSEGPVPFWLKTRLLILHHFPNILSYPFPLSHFLIRCIATALFRAALSGLRSASARGGGKPDTPILPAVVRAATVVAELWEQRTDDNLDSRQTHDGRQSTVQAVTDALLRQEGLGLSEEARDLANALLQAARACELSGNA
eukprot:7043319-Pyramimonas_sp.AAC.1